MLEALDAVFDAATAALDPRFRSANWALSVVLVVGLVWFAAFSIAAGAVTPIAWPGAGVAVLAAILLMVRLFSARGRRDV